MFFRHTLLFFKLLVWCYWFECYEPHSSRWLWQNNLNIPHVYTPSPSLIYCQEPRTGPSSSLPYGTSSSIPLSLPILCSLLNSAGRFPPHFYAWRLSAVPETSWSHAALQHRLCTARRGLWLWLRYCPWPLCYGSGQVEPWWDKSLRPRGAWPH